MSNTVAVLSVEAGAVAFDRLGEVRPDVIEILVGGACLLARLGFGLDDDQQRSTFADRDEYLAYQHRTGSARHMLHLHGFQYSQRGAVGAVLARTLIAPAQVSTRE